jgi:hypothetical protein
MLPSKSASNFTTIPMEPRACFVEHMRVASTSATGFKTPSTTTKKSGTAGLSAVPEVCRAILVGSQADASPTVFVVDGS